MALVALEIPKVGLVMESARLVRWLKNVGEAVRQGEPLLEVETEKSVVEIESTQSGRLVEILLQVDQEARVGDRIAWLETDPAGAARVPVAGVGATASAPPVSQTATASLPAASAASPVSVATRRNEVKITPAAIQDRPHGRIRSSPVARRLAAQQAVDLGRITGNGPARTCSAERRAAGHRGTVGPEEQPDLRRPGFSRCRACGARWRAP